jgi:hypothetical protein
MTSGLHSHLLGCVHMLVQAYTHTHTHTHTHIGVGEREREKGCRERQEGAYGRKGERSTLLENSFPALSLCCLGLYLLPTSSPQGQLISVFSLASLQSLPVS